MRSAHTPDDPMHPCRERTHRARWAAIGAALAVTLGAIGSSVTPTAAATRSTGERAVYVPVTPCRLIDTRPDTNVGVTPGTVGPSDTYVIQVRGVADPCPAPIPADATALAINATALDQTAPTFLTFWGDGNRPTTSNLNPFPGQPPTPNAVTVPLGSNGSFQFFNRAGDVHVIIDVLGFYVDHDHDDRYYTETEADARFADASDVYTRSEADGRFVQPTDVYTRAELDAREPIRRTHDVERCNVDDTGPGESMSGEWETCASVTVPTVGDWGYDVNVEYGWATVGPAAGECRVASDRSGLPRSVRKVGEETDTTSFPQQLNRASTLVHWGVTGATAGTTVEFQCRELVGDIDFGDIFMTVSFVRR